MKELTFLFVLFTVLISCSNDETVDVENAPENAVAVMKQDGSLDLLELDVEQLNANIIQAEQIHTFEENGRHFMRGYSNGNVITVALKPVDNSSSFYRVMDTACISRACEQGGGCMPKEDGYCSPCKAGLSGGDCKRITSTGPIVIIASK